MTPSASRGPKELDGGSLRPVSFVSGLKAAEEIACFGVMEYKALANRS